jgi:ubiquinone/menaquinone biosynthesis C-methylase UbiE
LEQTYTWAYLSDFGTRFFDHQAVVNTILWGNARRLIRWATDCVQPGSSVMQPAAVYGSFSRDLAAAVGPQGKVSVADVAAVQVALTRRKVADLPWVRVDQRDATTMGDGPYDAITCFFLLHEVPEEIKTQVVDRLLAQIKPGGRVIFVDYHRPRAWHPLRPIMMAVFGLLEPFARALWDREIASYASAEVQGTWKKDTRFGGLYQRVIFDRAID